jgi:transposase
MPSSAPVEVDLFDHEAVWALLAEKDTAIAARDQKLSSRELENAHLRLQIEKLRRDKYGASCEEVDRNLDQLELKLEELESAQAAEEAVTSVTHERSARSKPVRKTLPEHLKRKVVTHTPEESFCPDCGSGLHKLGEDDCCHSIQRDAARGTIFGTTLICHRI